MEDLGIWGKREGWARFGGWGGQEGRGFRVEGGGVLLWLVGRLLVVVDHDIPAPIAEL